MMSFLAVSHFGRQHVAKGFAANTLSMLHRAVILKADALLLSCIFSCLPFGSLCPFVKNVHHFLIDLLSILADDLL